MQHTLAQLQDLLARLGYLLTPAAPDVLDDPTRAALRRFQSVHQLTPSGEPDDPTWQALQIADHRRECVVIGQLVDDAGPIMRAIVAIKDRRLGDPANWPQLGVAPTAPDGSFLVPYTLDQVQQEATDGEPDAGDLIVELRELPVTADGFDVYRLPSPQPISDDDKVLGFDARRVEEIKIVLRNSQRHWLQGQSEYERLLAAFTAEWPEVSPDALDDGRREAEFVARELNVPQAHVDALVSAFRLNRRVFDGSVPEPILYGLARSDRHLADAPSLALASPGQLKEGILQSVQRLIIPPQPDQLIAQAIDRIRGLAPQQVLADSAAGGGVAYAAVLSDAIPDPSLQATLLRAAADSQGDPSSLWDTLRAVPQFAQPGAVERAQFALQLDALTARHVPLMSVLQAERGITSTRQLLDLDAADLQAIVRRPDVGVPAETPGETPEARATTYVSAIVGQLQQAFPTETVARVVGADAEHAQLASVLQKATSDALRANGAAFDIRTTHIDSYLAEQGASLLSDIPEPDRPRLVADLKRAQRLYRISTGPEAFRWLLNNTYDSAFQVAHVPQQAFVAQARDALGEPQALMMYSRAVQTSSLTLLTHVQLSDAIFIYPSSILQGEDRVEVIAGIKQDIAKYLPTWADLFGEVSLCACADCRSVYSPAAYLVDLLHFLDGPQKNAQNQTALDVLLSRRPDLAQLKLTCDNTNTVIPYVDLVNEVLESLVLARGRDPLTIPAFDTDGATADEQLAAPQHTNWAAYVTSDAAGAPVGPDRAVYPHTLPFDAALAAARTSLEHLGVSRAELMAAFSDGSMTNALAAERLGLSPNLFAAITGLKLDETPSDLDASVDSRFGWAPPQDPPVALTALPQVTVLLQRAGLTYAELLSLLEMRFVNPERQTVDVIQRLQVPGDDLLAFVSAGLVNPSASLVDALNAAGVRLDAFTAWGQTHLVGDAWTRLQRTLLVDGPPNQPCDLAAFTLRHLDPASPALTAADWLQLDRLLRLWRALGWTTTDLDLALAGLGAAEITPQVVRELAGIQALADQLGLSIPHVVALWTDLDPTRAGSLYDQRFHHRALLRMDPVFEPDWAGHVLVGATIGPHVAALQAGLRCSAADLAALREHLGLADPDAALDLPTLSNLFRRVVLARAVQLNVRDLIHVLTLSGLQPFVAPADDWTALRFVAAVRRLQQANVNAAQLGYVLDDTSAAPADAARDRLLAGLRDGLHAIAADLQPDNETDGSLTRRALALLQVDSTLAEGVLQIALGTDQTTVVLAAAPVPPPQIPPDWSDRLRYTPADQSLTCRGALTDAERTLLKSFSAAASYQAAVDALYAAPRAVLQQITLVLTARQIVLPDAAALLATSVFSIDPAQHEQLVGQRLQLILQAILPPLRAELSSTLVKQTVTGLPLAPAVVALLLEGERQPGQPVLPSSDPTRPLIADLLDLATRDDLTLATEAYELLARLRLLIETLSLAPEDIDALVRHVVALRSTPHHLFSYADWEAIASYARVPRMPQLWEQTTLDDAQAVIVAATSWPPEIVAGLVGADGFSLDLNGLQQVAQLQRVLQAGTLATTLGVSVAQAASWARQAVGQAEADAALRAAKAKYDEAAWLTVAKTLNDTLRDRRRTALVAFLQPSFGVTDPSGFYERLLIDVEMGTCMQTSRIKQAISTVQLFIQRCLLNLGPLVPPNWIDAERWSWMQNYRVWEANRKILLYPENWIVPELRDDKTPFFKELESDLLQDDVTDLSVERALVSYLEKLDTVARLQIVGMYVQNDFEAQEQLQQVVHIFGRTTNPAYSYFYRRYVVTQNGTALWTPWEKVPVDIQGALLAPVVFNRRLYVFWAVTTVKAQEPPIKDKPQQSGHVQEVQLAWSEYREGAWSPKQVTAADQALSADYPPDGVGDTTVQGTRRGTDVIERLEARTEGNRLRILCIATRAIFLSDAKKHVDYTSKVMIDTQGNVVERDGNTAYTYSLGTFMLDNAHAQLVKDDAGDLTWRQDGTVFRLGSNQLTAKRLAADAIPARTVLGAVPDAADLQAATWVQASGEYFIFSDTQRAYFAQFTSSVVAPGAVIGNPRLAFPHVRNGLAAFATADVTASNQALTQVRLSGERAANAWASANASLARLAAPPVSIIQGPPTSATHSSIWAAAAVEDIGHLIGALDRSLVLRFETAFDPFVTTYLARLQQYGLPGLYDPANQQLTLVPSFANRYRPDLCVAAPYPTDVVDFGETDKPGRYRTSAYSEYHWELFFHIPMLLADRLKQNQRFEAAMRCHHYVYNPTDGRGGYWKFLPFQKTPRQSIQDWLQQLHTGDADLQRQVAEWKDHPFQPHLIARMRVPAYQKYVVMQYVDNLIAWADQLFQRDTIETINQATQLYVMALELVGPRQQLLQPRGEPTPMTFAEMRGKLDALSNVSAEFENQFPTLSSASMAAAQDTAGLLGISRTLYFGLPPNDKLLGYWDTIADRLFKIRNCMNIAGVVRQLPLFEPPIDPALLVRAAAQGVDLKSVLSDLSAPLPYYRFEFVIRKAFDACADTKALGAALLAALEKKDAEVLAVMRATHETTLLTATLETRKQQESEAAAQIEALRRSRDTAVERLNYARWLMAMDDLSVPAADAELQMLPYGPKPAASGGVFLIDQETQELNASHSARDWQVRSAFMEVLASLAHYTPSFTVAVAPWGVGTEIEFGGQHVGPAFGAIARYQAGLGFQDSYDATHAGKMAGYQRRGQELALQANLAARDVMQIDKQLTAAELRQTIAQLERTTLETQIAQSALVEEQLKTKYTNAELYGWMQGQIADVYFQSYKLASELANQAERCFRFERGLTTSTYIQFGAWDSLRKGLLAGEKLSLQLRQLERAYQDQARRDLELTRHVSLLQVAPMALLQLKETGRCELELPEWLYDMDYPGHYLRGIKSVSISMPSVVGPYTPVNATLTLLANETRISSALSGGKYERDLESDDPRFVNDFSAIQAIATSGGQNDSGLFELNFRDERYLPFEGAGAASRWRIELDPECNRFDVDSLTDVILHLKYTARDGGATLRQKAKDRWKALVASADNGPLARLFSLKHEFPSEWHRLRTVATANGDHAQTFALSRSRFPLLFQRSAISISALDVFGVPTRDGSPTKLPIIRTPQPDDTPVTLDPGAPLPPLLHGVGAVGPIAVKDADDQAAWLLSVPAADVAASLAQLDDVLLVCRFTVKP